MNFCSIIAKGGCFAAASSFNSIVFTSENNLCNLLLLFSGFKLNFLKSQIVRFLENADLKNLVDQNVAKISEWLWMVAVVLALVFPGAGPELAAGFELCLWLSLTPIIESCY